MVEGRLSSEKFSEENTFCRQIIREINQVGISDRQRVMLIYLLSLELEDIEKMQYIATMLRAQYGDELFVIDKYESED